MKVTDVSFVECFIKHDMGLLHGGEETPATVLSIAGGVFRTRSGRITHYCLYIDILYLYLSIRLPSLAYLRGEFKDKARHKC
jgi:hypothetical protein